MERIEVQKLFSVEDCKANPHKWYVFGDNLIHQGHGGQAVIRSCTNAIGVPTKRLPSNTEDAYFSDQTDEYNAVAKKLIRLSLFYNDEKQKVRPTLVFPADGLGTGRAQLKSRSPQIYKLIDEFLRNNFKLEIMP